MQRIMRVAFTVACLLLIVTEKVKATLGVDWDEVYGEGHSSGSNWFGIILGLGALGMFLKGVPVQTLALLSALGGLAVIASGGGRLLAWVMFVGCGVLALYIYFSSNKEKSPQRSGPS